ncbi:MAG: hypothetical protein KAH06_02665 [Desulfobacterales bacterium]|nr:hypothetical protein [Desulfobacterales bacterium]
MELFKFEVKDPGNGSSETSGGLTFTTLNEQGNRLSDATLKDRMTGMLQFLGESGKHYLETGNMLKTS